MMKRDTKKELHGSPEEIDCCHWDRITFFRFIHQVYKIVSPVGNIWRYIYQAKGLRWDDMHWQRIFSTLDSDNFQIGNIWNLFSKELNK